MAVIFADFFSSPERDIQVDIASNEMTCRSWESGSPNATTTGGEVTNRWIYGIFQKDADDYLTLHIDDGAGTLNKYTSDPNDAAQNHTSTGKITLFQREIATFESPFNGEFAFFGTSMTQSMSDGWATTRYNNIMDRTAFYTVGPTMPARIPALSIT